MRDERVRRAQEAIALIAEIHGLKDVTNAITTELMLLHDENVRLRLLVSLLTDETRYLYDRIRDGKGHPTLAGDLPLTRGLFAESQGGQDATQAFD